MSLTPALVAAAALTAQLVGAKVTRDALFLSHHGATELTRVMVLTSSAAALAVVLLTSALRRFGPGRVVAALVLGSTGLFALEGALAAGAPRLAGELIYVHVGALGAPAVAAFWALLGERFDPYTARPAFARVGAASGFGGLVGSVVVWRLGAVMSLSASLGVLAGVGLLALVSLAVFTRAPGGLAGQAAASVGGQPASSSGQPASTGGQVASTGLAELRAAPYLRDLALVVLVASLTAALADYVLATGATASVGRGPALVQFFALFHLSVALASFLAQTLLAERATAWLGLVRATATLPVSLVVLGGAALVLPGVTPVALLRGAHSVLQNSLFRSAYELLYTPIPPARKRATKLLIDVACDRVGAIAGSALAALVVVVAPGAARPVLLALVVAVSLASLALGQRLHRGYLRSLAERLNSGVIRLDAGQIRDAATLLTLTRSTVATGPWTPDGLSPDGLSPDALSPDARSPDARSPDARSPEGGRPAGESATGGDPVAALVADLRSADPARRRGAFARCEDPWAVTHLALSLAQPALVPEATAALRRLAPRAVGQLVDLLLDETTPLAVRRRLPFVLKACRSTRAVQGLLPALELEDVETRDHVAVALATLADAGVAVPAEPLVEAVLRELGGASGRAGPGGREAYLFTLLSLAYDRDGIELAARALRGGDAALRGTALEYLDRRLPERVRQPLLAHLGGPELLAGVTPRPAQDALAELRRSSTDAGQR